MTCPCAQVDIILVFEDARGSTMGTKNKNILSLFSDRERESAERERERDMTTGNV